MESIYWWFKAHAPFVSRFKRLVWWFYLPSIVLFATGAMLHAHVPTAILVTAVTSGTIWLTLEFLSSRAAKVGPACYICGGATKWSLYFDPDIGVNRQTYKCTNRECGNRILIKG